MKFSLRSAILLPSLVSILMNITLNSLSGKSLNSIHWYIFSAVLYYILLIWNIFLCLFILCDFLYLLQWIRQNSYLSQNKWVLKKWPCVEVSPVQTVCGWWQASHSWNGQRLGVYWGTLCHGPLDRMVRARGDIEWGSWGAPDRATTVRQLELKQHRPGVLRVGQLELEQVSAGGPETILGRWLELVWARGLSVPGWPYQGGKSTWTLILPVLLKWSKNTKNWCLLATPSMERVPQVSYPLGG